jgi:hypothetical protein
MPKRKATKLGKFRRITTLGNQVYWLADDGEGPVFARWDGPGQPLMFSLGSSFYNAQSSAEMNVLATESDVENVLLFIEKEADHESKQAQ